MAMVYSSFANEGNMIMPYIEYKEVTENPEYYKRYAFGKNIADEINLNADNVMQKSILYLTKSMVLSREHFF